MSGRSGGRLPNWTIGLIAIVVVLFGFYLAFTKKLPFSGEGYQVEAVFRDAQSLALKSPVRIAGVQVGEVTKVETLAESNAAVVTMKITEAGRPIHEDARIQLRPRLFLEGNLFVDIKPGSPSSPEVEGGGRIPVQQTSNSVQLDQILTNVLQADVRGNLQLALKELGDAFDKHGGAEGLRDFNASGGPAYKNTSYVNEALLGTEAHDLSNLIRNFDIVAAALDRNEPQLQSLVTNLRVVTGSFAAEDDALEAAVRELPGTLFAAQPVFENLNASFPFLRAFSREALPGVRSTPETLEVSTPFIYQLRKLVSKPELRGLVKDLRPTVPRLAKLARVQVPFMEETRAVSSCFNNVIIPWANDTVPADDTDGEVGRVYEETGYGLTGIAGESRSGDANGEYIRVGLGTGNNLVDFNDGLVPDAGENVGTSLLEILGSEPPQDSSARTPFRPGIPCENQETPDLRSGGAGAAPPQTRINSNGSQTLTSGPASQTTLGRSSKEYADIYTDYLQAQSVEASGNAVRADNLMEDVMKRFRAYDKRYGDYWDKVGGAG